MKYHSSIFLLGIVCLSLHSLCAESAPTPFSSVTPLPSSTHSGKKNALENDSKSHKKQQKGIIVREILEKITVEPSDEPLSILISLSKQRAYLLIAGQVALDSPISTGKKDHETLKGEFMILEKDLDHHSNLYGDFVDESGRVVRSGVNGKIDAAPSGAHFRGASMKYFLRVTPEGVGMHVGILPGYPASHGCIRMPSDMVQLFYNIVPNKTPVTITD